MAHFLGPLRGPILSGNTRKPKGFEAFRGSKKAGLWVHSGAISGSLFGSISGTILASILARLGLPFSPHFGPRGPRLENFLQTLTD